MLFIDLIDVLYLVVGVLVGVGLTTLIDSRICDDCKERSNNERA